MSQPLMRKAKTAEEVPRVRSSFAKPSGDASLNPNRQQQPRSRSKNKIPKNLRYDLDNALVGLCDVWFEDIKPHLIRNNIKVHIHGDGPSPASGDHQRVPPGAPGCSHLDPGAASDPRRQQCVNFADCSLTRRTASRAPCARPPAPPSPVSPLELILQSLSAPQESKDVKAHSKKKKNGKKRPQKSPVIPPVRNQLGQPRLSQTYTVMNAPPNIRIRNTRSAATPYTRDKGSQTHFDYYINPGRILVDQGTQTVHRERRHTSTRAVPCLPTPSFNRCPGKTTLLPPRLKPMKQSHLPLCSDILVNNKADKLDQKEVKVLYYSPTSSRFHSSTTLLETPRRKRKNEAGKIPPWR